MTVTLSFAVLAAAAPPHFTRVKRICGAVLDSTNHQPIRSLRFDVYRVSDPSQDCCVGASLVGNFVTKKHGEFSLKSARKGFYYLVAPTSPKIIVPIEVFADYSGGACEDSPTLNVNTKTGEVEILYALD